MAWYFGEKQILSRALAVDGWTTNTAGKEFVFPKISRCAGYYPKQCHLSIQNKFGIKKMKLVPINIRVKNSQYRIEFNSINYFTISLHTGTHGFLWIYASISALGCIFIAICLPETRGKTPFEIADFYEAKSTKNSSKYNMAQASNFMRKINFPQFRRFSSTSASTNSWR